MFTFVDDSTAMHEENKKIQTQIRTIWLFWLLDSGLIADCHFMHRMDFTSSSSIVYRNFRSRVFIAVGARSAAVFLLLQSANKFRCFFLFLHIASLLCSMKREKIYFYMILHSLLLARKMTYTKTETSNIIWLKRINKNKISIALQASNWFCVFALVLLAKSMRELKKKLNFLKNLNNENRGKQ